MSEPLRHVTQLGRAATVPERIAMNVDHLTGRSFFQDRASLVPLTMHVDARGNLISLDFSKLPFMPRHGFVVRDVPVGAVRGRHAHRRAAQFLICLAGRVSVELRDKSQTVTLPLEVSDTGLLIGSGIWAAQSYLDAGTVLLGFLSEPYDRDGYVDEPFETIFR
jgi:hypothetical protein